MGKKKNNNNNSNSNDGLDKKVVEEVKKEEKNNAGAVVLKVDIHCEGCASKIVKCGRSFPGVESVKADSGSNKVTVSGKVDPLKIRDYLQNKTKKKVELISPQPKKEDAPNNKNKEEKKPDDKKPEADNKKPKEAPVTTAVLKLSLHCQGCIDKIRKTVSKTKGVHDVTLDKQKETVTVKGTMDVKALTESLKEKLKRHVEIVPPKKEKEGGEGGEKGGDKKDGKKGGDGGGGGSNGGQQQQQQFYGFDGGAGIRMEGNMMVHPGFGGGNGIVGRPIFGDGFAGRPVYGDGYMGQPVYGYGHEYGYGYRHGPVPGYPAHMQFNDENPNACIIM